jgi:hypothetical protein
MKMYAIHSGTIVLKIELCEYLIGYEGNALAYTGNVEEDLLNKHHGRPSDARRCCARIAAIQGQRGLEYRRKITRAAETQSNDISEYGLL